MPNITVLMALVLACSVLNAQAEETCSYQPISPAQSGAADLAIGRHNWLAVEHLRIGLDAPQRYMPGVAMRSKAKAFTLEASHAPIDPDRLTTADPADGVEKSLQALLDMRLYADGIVILKGNEILLERYRAGFLPESPRLLLHATRPVLTAMLAEAVDSGRLSREHSLARALPALPDSANLRKTSVQRLLDDRSELVWAAEDYRHWRAASGWDAASTPPAPQGVRNWLKSRTEWPRNTEHTAPEIDGPEGELLVWVLENATEQPVSRSFCESVLSAIGAEHEAFWASDPSGTGLADGLSLSLRDFARLGLALVNSRGKRGGRAVVPNWLAEAVATTGPDQAAPDTLHGLGADVAWKYRFAILGQSHQAAIMGPFGNSLLIDFDRNMVIALFASFPKEYSAVALASLRKVWTAVSGSLNDQPSPK